jgi:predicted alpha/beta-hydrolase family hydrolase
MSIEVLSVLFPFYQIGSLKKKPANSVRMTSWIQVQDTISVYNTIVLYLGLSEEGKGVVGERVSCMVAGKKDTKVAAVVCLGYPLKGDKGPLRDTTLLELQAPVLFVQGSKDNMCPLNELEKVRKKMTVKNDLHVVEGGDHSLKKRKRVDGMTQDDAERSALDHIQRFLVEVLDDVP